MNSSAGVLQTGRAGVRMRTRVGVCLHVNEESQQRRSEHRQLACSQAFPITRRVGCYCSYHSPHTRLALWLGGVRVRAQRNDGFAEGVWNNACSRGRCLLEQTQQALHKSDTNSNRKQQDVCTRWSGRQNKRSKRRLVGRESPQREQPPDIPLRPSHSPPCATFSSPNPKHAHTQTLPPNIAEACVSHLPTPACSCCGVRLAANESRPSRPS
jgi:hypothetical protein